MSSHHRKGTPGKGARWSPENGNCWGNPFQVSFAQKAWEKNAKNRPGKKSRLAGKGRKEGVRSRERLLESTVESPVIRKNIPLRPHHCIGDTTGGKKNSAKEENLNGGVGNTCSFWRPSEKVATPAKDRLLCAARKKKSNGKETKGRSAREPWDGARDDAPGRRSGTRGGSRF